MTGVQEGAAAQNGVACGLWLLTLYLCDVRALINLLQQIWVSLLYITMHNAAARSWIEYTNTVLFVEISVVVYQQHILLKANSFLLYEGIGMCII